MFSVSVVPPGPVSVSVMGVPTGSGCVVPACVRVAVPLKLMDSAGVIRLLLTARLMPCVAAATAKLLAGDTTVGWLLRLACTL